MLSNQEIERLFELHHCNNNKDLIRKNSTTNEYVLPSIADAYSGFKSAINLFNPS